MLSCFPELPFVPGRLRSGGRLPEKLRGVNARKRDVTDLRGLLPLVDRSVCALLEDLRARGRDDDVLVVVLGEFGRTPRIAQPGPGREHWADAGCVLFAGG